MFKLRASLSATVLVLCVFLVSADTSELFLLWDCDADYKLHSRWIELEPDKLTPQGILDRISKRYRDAGPKIVLIKHGIAYVNFEGDAQLVTERSGTTAALRYKAAIVFNLTEFPDINAVYFFDHGSHFTDGKSDRIDFWKGLALEDKRHLRDSLHPHKRFNFGNLGHYIEAEGEVGDEDSIRHLENLKRSFLYLAERIDESVEKIKARANMD